MDKKGLNLNQHSRETFKKVRPRVHKALPFPHVWRKQTNRSGLHEAQEGVGVQKKHFQASGACAGQGALLSKARPFPGWSFMKLKTHTDSETTCPPGATAAW